jgi:hypothetical protein
MQQSTQLSVFEEHRLALLARYGFEARAAGSSSGRAGARTRSFAVRLPPDGAGSRRVEPRWRMALPGRTPPRTGDHPRPSGMRSELSDRPCPPSSSGVIPMPSPRRRPARRWSRGWSTPRSKSFPKPATCPLDRPAGYRRQRHHCFPRLRWARLAGATMIARPEMNGDSEWEARRTASTTSADGFITIRTASSPS